MRHLPRLLILVLYTFILLHFYTSAVSAADSFSCKLDSSIGVCDLNQSTFHCESSLAPLAKQFCYSPANNQNCKDEDHDHVTYPCSLLGGPTPTAPPLQYHDCTDLPQGHCVLKSSGCSVAGEVSNDSTTQCQDQSGGGAYNFTCCHLPTEATPTPIAPTLVPLGKIPCGDVVPNPLNPFDPKREAHPLRPYPGSPCDTLIPASNPEASHQSGYISFACGKSLNTEASVKLPYCPVGQICTKTKNIDFDVSIDLSQAEIPILTNTENLSLDDATKANNYLAWYLNGTNPNWLDSPLSSAPQFSNVNQCMGNALSEYMNTIVDKTVHSPNIKLLSPAFNLTNPAEVEIFKSMSNAGAKFDQLYAFAGNTYTVNGTAAYDYIATTTSDFDHATWKDRFAGQNIVLTEFGDFDTGDPAKNRGQVISTMHQEFTRTATDNQIVAITYFNALGTNPSFLRHQLSPTEFATIITGSHSTKSGINSGLAVKDNGEFIKQVKTFNSSPTWAVELITSPNDLDTVIRTAQVAKLLSIKLILRPCYGTTCEFANPIVYADFINKLSTRLGPTTTGDVWIIAGPNEPAAETWATPNCTQFSQVNTYDRFLTYSGPLKKLLSFDTQQDLRRTFIKGPVKEDYHDYLIGCREKLKPLEAIQEEFKSIFSLASLITEAWRALPLGAKVYNLISNDVERSVKLIQLIATVSSEIGQTDRFIIQHRFNDEGFPEFADDLSVIISKSSEAGKHIANYINDILHEHATACTGNTAFLIGDDAFRITKLQGHLPPNPTADVYVKDRDQNNKAISYDFPKYWNDYRTWVGADYKLFNLSINLPWHPSYIGEIFQNVPFSSLEDTVGEATIALVPDPAHSADGTNHPNSKLDTIHLIIKPSTDSRLNFPAVRNLNAMSQILAKLIRSKDQDSLDPTSTGLVSQHISDHDPVWGKIDGEPANTYLKPNLYDPQPLYSQIGQDDKCQLSDFRINPGDKLYGGKIEAHLTYSQTFTYSTSVPNPHGYPGGTTCTTNSQCQTNVCQDPDLFGKRYCSEPSGSSQPTEARIAVFTKFPLIEKIYDNLVVGSNSVLRRFLPARPTEHKCTGPTACSSLTELACKTHDTCSWVTVTPAPDSEYLKGELHPGNTVPGASGVGYTAKTNTNDVEHAQVSSGDKTGGAQIYYARLGSLADYFLGSKTDENYNLQKLLRPQGFSSNEFSGTSTGNYPTSGQPQTECRFSDAQLKAAIGSAAQKYQVPASMLHAIYTIENGGSYIPNQSYTCQDNGATAWGPTQITDLTYTDGAITTPDERISTTACTQSAGRLNRCNIYDSMEIASRILLKKLNRWDISTKSVSQGGIAVCDLDSINFASCAYYGFDKPQCWDDRTNAWKKRINRTPPSGDLTYGGIVCALMASENGQSYCPVYPPIQIFDAYHPPSSSSCVP